MFLLSLFLIKKKTRYGTLATVSSPCEHTVLDQECFKVGTFSSFIHMLLAYLFNLNNSLLNQAISPFSTGLISSVSSFNIRVISHCSAYSNFVVLFLMCVLYFREEKTLSTPASNLAQPRTSLDPTATDFFGQRSA